MWGHKQNQDNEKYSMTISVFIALFVVSVFCALSIIIVENIESIAIKHNNKRMQVPEHYEMTKFVF